MATETYAFTIEQIKAIYAAGIKRGGDEATAFDWGCRASGGQFDELEEALDDIWNDGKPFEDRLSYDEIRARLSQHEGERS